MTAFRARVLQRERLIGTILTLGATEVAEIFTLVGFDWLWIDLEHTPLTLERVQQVVQTVAGRAGTMVRVPWNDPIHIKRVLDTGCDGVLVPQVRTAEEARQAVAAAKYPPAGIRSVGIARAQQYGMTLQECIERANDRVCVMVQIEHIDAMDNIDEILGVPDVDAVIVGPYDLSASMGYPGQFAHPDVASVISLLAARLNKHRMPWGAFVPNVETAKAQMDREATLIALATDSMYLWRGAEAAMGDLKT